MLCHIRSVGDKISTYNLDLCRTIDLPALPHPDQGRHGQYECGHFLGQLLVTQLITHTYMGSSIDVTNILKDMKFNSGLLRRIWEGQWGNWGQVCSYFVVHMYKIFKNNFEAQALKSYIILSFRHKRKNRGNL